MKLACLHGYFKFEETKVGQVSDWASLTGLKLSRQGSYFTFDTLLDAPKYSIKGSPWLGVTALETFEGEPWEVMEANGFVYDFSRDLIVPLLSVTQVVSIKAAGHKFVSNGLILPGSLTDEGERVTDYAAHYSKDTLRWLYSEVSYV